MHHHAAAARPPLFAIFAGLAMMLSPKVGELAFEVGLSTQALAQPAVGVLGRRRAPRERRLGARKGACLKSVVGARESPFLALFCPRDFDWEVVCVFSVLRKNSLSQNESRNAIHHA